MDERQSTGRSARGPRTNQGQRGKRPGGSNSRRPKSSRARRRKRTLLIRTIIVIILIIAAAGGALFWMRYGPSKEKADLNDYYGISGDDGLALIVNNEVLETGGKMINKVPYIEYSVVREHINRRFYWDPNESILLYTLPAGNVSVTVGSSEYTELKEKKTADYAILKTEGSTAYIALAFLQQYTNIDYSIYENPNRAMIISDWGETEVSKVKRDTEVRYQAGVKSPILTTVKKSDTVTMIEDEGNWEKVRTSDGVIGYVRDNTLRAAKTETISRDFVEPEYTSLRKDGKINLAWNNVTNADANSYILQTIAGTKGLTTVSPTWFSIADTDGNMQSIASAEYVNYAHQSNLEVWAALQDFHGGLETPEQVYEVLSYTSKRENLINQVIAAALQTGIDGINLDFEQISYECGEHYIQFVRELSVKCRQNGLVLSIDNYVPMPYNEHYDLEEQGIVADYVVIMGYDEHTPGSETAGSVASYNYVKAGIEAALEKVPAEKLINAIPFYTRLWFEDRTANELRSEALGMAEAETRLAEVGVTAQWDETTRQNYAEWESEGGIYKIWLEDSASIEEKLKLIRENDLGGVAEWRLGYEKSEIWDLILQYIN